jgi:hypothetical protein
VINTITALVMHPPQGGLKALPVPFLLGCVLAATGAFLVARFAPTNTGAAAAPVAATAPAGPVSSGR